MNFSHIQDFAVRDSFEMECAQRINGSSQSKAIKTASRNAVSKREHIYVKCRKLSFVKRIYKEVLISS